MKASYYFILILLFAGSLSSCKKCKECYMTEEIQQSGETNTTELGEKCGDDLESIDGTELQGNDGVVNTYCE